MVAYKYEQIEHPRLFHYAIAFNNGVSVGWTIKAIFSWTQTFSARKTDLTNGGEISERIVRVASIEMKDAPVLEDPKLMIFGHPSRSFSKRVQPTQ